VISSLPKPVQNDYDTVIIDMLTRYGLQNKPVQNFVQAVASTVKSMRRFPRMLMPSKPKTDVQQPDLNNDAKVEDSAEKKPGIISRTAGKVDGFLTKLDNIENTFNKRGLLGVFLEQYKNKQENAKAKIAENNKDRDKNSIELSAQAPDETKTSDDKTNIFAKILTKIDSTLEAFDKKGPLGLVKNIFNTLKPKPDTPTTQKSNITQITNKTDSPNTYTANRISNIQNTSVLPKVKGNEQEMPMFDTEGQQSQKQNIFREFTVVLGGVNEEGKKDLKGIFEVIFDEQLTKQQKIYRKGGTEKEQDSGAGDEADEGLLSLLMDVATLKALSGGKGAKPPKPPKKPGFFKRLFGGGAKGGGKGRGLGRLLKIGAGLLAGGAAAATVAPKVLPGPPAGAPPLPDNIPAKPGTPPPSTPAVKPSAAPTVPPKAGGGMMSKVLGTGGSILSKLITPVIATIEGVQNIGTSIDVLSKEENKELSTGQKIAAGTLAASGGAADIVTGVFDPTTWGIDKAFGVDLFGEGISKEFLNLIGAKEKGKSMGETLRDRSIGLGKQSNEIAKQKAIEEAKKEFKDQKEQLQEKDMGLQALNIKASNLGYKDLDDFAKAFASGKEKRRITWDDKSQSVIIINPDNTEEAHKFIPGKGFQGKPEIITPDNKPQNKVQLPTSIPNLQDVEKPPLTSPVTPPATNDLVKPGIPPGPISTPVTPFALDFKTATQIPTPPSLELNQPIALTPDTTKVTPPIPPSINETHITNNTADKAALTDIASNTEKTNKSLGTLSEAVFALAKVFDAKTMSGGNNFLINNGQGGVKEYTSTSQMAENNNDAIRGIRRQFLGAIG